ncbi:hypothetical protein ACFL13_02735 [Patescibacteria group bacterium]
MKRELNKKEFKDLEGKVNVPIQQLDDPCLGWVVEIVEGHETKDDLVPQVQSIVDGLGDNFREN